MKALLPRMFMAASLLAVLPAGLDAAIVRLTAVINASQETIESTSSATGIATMTYDVTNNTFDLLVTLEGFTNALTNSHIHEAPAGTAGGAAHTLGPETAYQRDGTTLSASFLEIEYGGDPAALITGGAYLNFHSAAWPDGEVRGQLIPDPVRLSAVINAGQETSAVDSAAYGAALGEFDPASSEISLTVFLYNFTHTLTNSHIHEAIAGVDGSVVVTLGAADAYKQSESNYTQTFASLGYDGDVVALLNEGAYLNFHSDLNPSGEIRGQLRSAPRTGDARLVNVSARGFTGVGENALITGFVVEGSAPLAVLVTGRGPFLTPFGVANALADPVSSVYDASGARLSTNDDFLDGPHVVQVIESGFGFDPTLPAESAHILILPPGVYTNVVSSADGTSGIALAETYEVSWSGAP